MIQNSIARGIPRQGTSAAGSVALPAARQNRRSIFIITAIFIFSLLFCAMADAQNYYWESPRPLAEGLGRYPAALQVDGGVLVIWQESEISAGPNNLDSGRAWISRARYSAESGWEIERRFSGPYEFKGQEPTLFTATAASPASIAIAVASGDGEIGLLFSSDGGRSFQKTVKPAPSGTAVAPRIFPSGKGSWIVFATQGQNESLRLYYATSAPQAGAGMSPSGTAAQGTGAAAADSGAQTFSTFKPFTGESDQLSLSFLPDLLRLPNGNDLAVFQSSSGNTRGSFQLYSKLSTDGGLSWSAPRRLTDFTGSAETARGGADAYDNQRPSLAYIGDKIWLTWERSAPGGTTQIFVMNLDLSGAADSRTAERVSTGTGSASVPEILNVKNQPMLLWTDTKRGGGRVYIAARAGIDWNETELSRGSGDASFGRGVLLDNRLYAFWQSTESSRDRIFMLEPDTSVASPSIVPVNFVSGRRSRSENVQFRINMPSDSSGVAGFSYVWGRDPKALPPQKLMALPGQNALSLEADADGDWYLCVSALDYAGNWSAPARQRFTRDRTPPPAPIFMPPDADAAGYLVSNSFTIHWTEPDLPGRGNTDDVAGYTWTIKYAGPLERVRRTAALNTAAQAEGQEQSAAAKAGLPGLSVYESRLVSEAGGMNSAIPPAALLGASGSASYNNIDDGYYIFAAAAIDQTGNISPTTAILIKLNKYIPYTLVNFVTATRDDLGNTELKIVGKGFNIEGPVARIALDRDAKEPYDVDASRESGAFRILSDYEISGLSFSGLDEGKYRIGIFHPGRGWYWTGPVITIDISGTVKFSAPEPAYIPSWRLAAQRRYHFSIYDALVIILVLFSAFGIVFASGKTIEAAREAGEVRREVLALVEGGPMPSKQKEAAVGTIKRRGTGLTAKFTLTISFLVLLTVLMVAGTLGVTMIRTQSTSLATGLEQRAKVLLESVAQGARSYLPAQNILELGFLPQQTKAMSDAVYITVTGYGESGSTAPDVVWATNDPGIAGKIDTKALTAGASQLTDSLSPTVRKMMAELNDKAASLVGQENETLASLTREGTALATKLDDTSQRRLAEISSTSRDIQSDITQKLTALSDQAEGSSPAFDAATAAQTEQRYIFYKPILFRSSQDQLYYRGLVRLEVSTSGIVAEVIAARNQLIRRTLIIAAAALAFGILGAFILSSIIVNPIRKLVNAIATIRDTDDKEKLEGLNIEVKSRDELFTLADTVNQMTSGLVQAAKASKDLTVGKSIQKMFIPLDLDKKDQKLTTGARQTADFEWFGYYEGAKGVSGDYFDIEQLDDHNWYFIKCDVSGKGVPAALIMVEVATMVRNHFGAVLEARRAEEELEAAAKRQGKAYREKELAPNLDKLCFQINGFIEGMKYRGRFAAFTVGIYDVKTGLAKVCNAGDRYIHIWRGSKCMMETVDLPDAPTAGTFPNELVEMKAPYKTAPLRLGHNEALFLYTDGIEEAKRHFRNDKFEIVPCTAVEKDKPHNNHSGGQDNEEFGNERIEAVVKAVETRGSYRLVKEHAPEDTVTTFDFSSCTGSLEEKVMALVSVEKVFRMYIDPRAEASDTVLVDARIDAFLEKHFDQYRLYCGHKKPNPDTEHPEYLIYEYLKSDDQYDDLTILAIGRK